MNSQAVTVQPLGLQIEIGSSVSRRIWLSVGSAFLATGGLAWVFAQLAGPDDWWMHGAWCLLGLAIASVPLSRILYAGFGIVITDHRLVFVGAFALYFLIGASLLALGPEVQADAVLRYYPITAADALRVDALNGVGFGIALLAATLSSGRWLALQAERASVVAGQAPAALVIGIFLVLGTSITTYVFLHDIGLHNTIVPGIVRSGTRLALAAVFLSAMYRGRGEWSLRIAGVALVAILFIGGTIQFSKTESLLALAALIAGLALRFGTMKVVPVGVVALAALFTVLGDIASYGRSAVRYEGTTSFSERWTVIKDAWQEAREFSEVERYGAWGRLCYVPSQAAAIEFWETGDGGDGFRMIPWVLVPRIAAADKPNITKTGTEFHAKITGQDTSSTGQGVFASGYYHGGIGGFIFASLISGWILAQTSAIARSIVAQRALLLLPLGLMGMYIAFRIDGDFVADYVGLFIIVLYPILALSMMYTAARRRVKASTADQRARGH